VATSSDMIALQYDSMCALPSIRTSATTWNAPYPLDPDVSVIRVWRRRKSRIKVEGENRGIILIQNASKRTGLRC